MLARLTRVMRNFSYFHSSDTGFDTRADEQEISECLIGRVKLLRYGNRESCWKETFSEGQVFDDARIYQVCKQSSSKIVNIVVVTNIRIVNLCKFNFDL